MAASLSEDLMIWPESLSDVLMAQQASDNDAAWAPDIPFSMCCQVKKKKKKIVS